MHSTVGSLVSGSIPVSRAGSQRRRRNSAKAHSTIEPHDFMMSTNSFSVFCRMRPPLRTPTCFATLAV